MFSEFAIQFALQILLPAFLILDLLQGRYKSKLDWFIRVCVFGLAILFAFLTARWDLSSYYLRIIVPLLFLTASYIAFRRIRSGSSSSSRHVRWITLAPYVILIMALLWLNVNVLGGYFYSDSEEPVELSFPLRGALSGDGGERLGRRLLQRRLSPARQPRRAAARAGRAVGPQIPCARRIPIARRPRS